MPLHTSLYILKASIGLIMHITSGSPAGVSNGCNTHIKQLE